MINNNKLFKFVEHKDTEEIAVCLLEEAGKFQGVIYRYGQVKLAKEENDDGSLNLTYDWDMLDTNGIPKEEFYVEEFSDLTGVILEMLLESAIKKENELYVNANSGENDNISIALQ